MDTLRHSTLGQFVRFTSRGRFLTHPDLSVTSEELLQRLERSKLRINSDSGDTIENGIDSPYDVKPEDRNCQVNLREAQDGLVLDGWYSADDPENPQNWSNLKKYLVGLLMCLYTFAVYIGASLYVPAQPYVMEEFGVGLTVASLGMAIYVLGYGCGPLLFSPLSEYDTRDWSYHNLCWHTQSFRDTLDSHFASGELCWIPGPEIPLGLLWFTLLANSGATFQDIFPPSVVFYIVAAWATFATMAQAFGPLLTTYSVPVRGWRWSQWELLWLVGPVLVLMIVALPETSASTILLRRARRLRAATGNDTIRAQSELDQAKLSIKEIAFDALIKPWEINILDPAVLYTTLYTGLVYGIFYTFFEVFPLVYQNEYHFDGGGLSLTFLAVAVCMLIVVPLYMIYFRIGLAPRIAKQGMPPLEDFLVVGLFTAWLLPAGLFIFAFTGKSHIHWIVSLIGVVIATAGIYLITQAMFLYVPLSYPKYAASLLAANGLSRSILAAAAILFAPPMFRGMGISGGVSLLAGLTVVCWIGMYVLYRFGARLRAKSRFAVA